MKKLSLLLIALSLLALQATALVSEIGYYPLEPGAGSRPYGLGGAFVGLADDVNTVLYNPGGMAWAKGISLSLRDASNVTAIQAYPTGFSSSIGLGVITQKLTNIPLAGGATAYSSGDIIVVAFGGKLSTLFPDYNDSLMERVGVGFSVKRMLGQTFRRTDVTGDRSGSGWDLDVGVLWKAGKWWSAGVVGQNILPKGTLGGGKLVWDSGPEEGFPSSLKLGVAGKLISEDFDSPIFMDSRELTLAGEIDYGLSRPLLFRLGTEFVLEKSFFLRAGLMQQYNASSSAATNLNYGVGVRQDRWSFDLSTYCEPLTDQIYTYLSVIYFPKGWELVKQLDMAAPAVILEQAIEQISLENNLVTYDEKFEVTGRVKPGVEVYINDLQASVDLDNNFKVMIPLRLQKNLVLVEARYQGEKKNWKYKVLRKAQVEVAETKELAKQIKQETNVEQKQKLEQKAEQLKQVEDKVEELVTIGVIEVTPEAAFELQAGVSRGELSSWLVKAAEVKLPDVTQDVFVDVPKDHPLAAYIKVIADLGLLKPFPDGTFRPQAVVTKEEGDDIFKYFGVEQQK